MKGLDFSGGGRDNDHRTVEIRSEIWKVEGFVDRTDVVRAGVYVLCWRGRPVYVGQARKLGQRIAQHAERGVSVMTPFGKRMRLVRFDRVLVRVCEAWDLDRLEREAIEHFRPRYNIQHNTEAPVMSFRELAGLLIEQRGGQVPMPLPSAPRFERRI